MRSTLLALLLTLPVHPPAAQSSGTHAGTWYAAQSATVVMRSSSDSLANPLDTSSLVTLELTVDGNAITGEERRELTIAASEFANPKAFTVAAGRAVTGTVEGDAVRLVMTPERGGAPLVYEGTLSPDGRRLTLVFVPDESQAGLEMPPLVFERTVPKPRSFK
jgi:hypothetical protein